MPVPTHRDDCRTTLWQTRCFHCQEIVYFFACTCGSRVFFDLNRPPWNPHKDRCIPYLMSYLRDVEGRSSTDIRRLVEEHAYRNNLPIPPDIHQHIIIQENRDLRRVQIIEVFPSERCTVSGRIIEVNEQVNFLRRLKYPDNAMTRAFLGDLVNPYVEIVLRQDLDKETFTCLEFTFFLRKTTYTQSRLRQGLRAIADLRTYSLPDGKKIWIADTIRRG
ncbi:MAG: hypothetical protein WHS83_05870 [Chloroflexus sp.]|uniref:hypothetical protein n=1 Tax=Chloroflexus sp. TaxID=1904827 RepID=UPI00309A1CD8